MLQKSEPKTLRPIPSTLMVIFIRLVVAQVWIWRARTLSDVLKAIGGRVKESKPGTVVVTNSDWHQGQLKEQRVPLRRDWDPVFSDVPVVVIRGGHEHGSDTGRMKRLVGLKLLETQHSYFCSIAQQIITLTSKTHRGKHLSNSTVDLWLRYAPLIVRRTETLVTLFRRAGSTTPDIKSTSFVLHGDREWEGI